MADDFNIQLQIKVNESQALIDVNAVLKRLEQKINPLMVKLDFDDSKLRVITQQLQASLQQMQSVGGKTGDAFKSMAGNVGSSFTNVGSQVKLITEQLKKDVRQLQDSFGTLKTVRHFEYQDGNKTEMYRVREFGSSSLRTKTVSEPNGNPLSEDIVDTGQQVALKRSIEDIKQQAREQIAIAKEQAANEQKINTILEQRDQIYRKINNVSDPRTNVMGLKQRFQELQNQSDTTQNNLIGARENGDINQVISLEKELNRILNEQLQITHRLSSARENNSKQLNTAYERTIDLNSKLEKAQSGKQGIEDLQDKLASIQTRKSQLLTVASNSPEEQVKTQQQINKLTQEEIEITRRLISEREKAAKALQQGVDKLAASQEKRELQQAKSVLDESKRLMGLGDKIGDFSNFGGNISETIKNIKQQLYEQFGQNAKVSVIRTMQGDNEVYKYSAQLERAKGLVEEYRGAVDKSTKAIYQNGDVTRNSLSRNLGLMDRMKVALQNVPVWMASMTLFWGSLRSLQHGAEYIKELDDAMLDLRKVTDETRQTYADFAKEATVIGSQLKTSSTEVIKATAEFARIGYDLNQAKILAKEALLYSSVGDVDAKTATSDMVSIIKGYGLVIDAEGKNIRHVVDALNEVGNSYAVTVEGLGSALKRSAASLHEAGNSYQESIAMVVGANAVVQDPEVVG